MTVDLFIETINKLRDFVEKASKVEELTGFNWTESFIGELFDIFYDVLIPGATDMIFEDFGELLFADGVTDQDIEDFWNMYKESLE